MTHPIDCPVPPPQNAPAAPRWHRWLGMSSAYLFVIFLLIIGRALSADFLSASNLLQVVRDVSILGIVAVGVGFITVSGHYVDLSIPGIMAVSGIVAVALLPHGFVIAVLAGLAVGTLLGLINGLVVGYLRLNPIIWTLAAMALIDGITRWAYGGKWIYADAATPSGALFEGIYRANIFGAVPLAVILLAAAAIVAHLVLHNTVYGRRLTLTGSAYSVASMTGVNVKRVVAVAFGVSGLMAALAGIIKTSLSMYGDVETGLTYDFQAITAVVLGGMVLAGGRGSIAGIIGGVLVIGLLGRILPLIPGVDQDMQLAIRGVIFVLVVAISTVYQRKAGRSDA
ncbi:MAG TPA: ABC transporter permease [Armatimonadota bacterium]|nr:ABC transporter permease [Armatimonadota bacterium]